MSSEEGDDCPCCSEVCAKDGGLKCGGCCDRYHFGSCSGITKKTFRSKGDSWRKAWQCPSCVRANSKGSKKVEDIDFAASFAALHSKLDGLMTLKSTVEKIEQSVQVMSDKHDKILEQLSRHDKEIAALKKRLTGIEKREHACESEQIVQDIADLEWQSRKLNLEFHGIPVAENEDLLAKVNEVATQINVPHLATSDVVSVHRLPASRDKIPGIIVRFSNQTVKDSFLDKKTELNRSKSNFFILENLTKRNRHLLAVAKAWTQNNGYRYAWHRNNKIFVKRIDGDKAIIVRNERDLDSLV